MDNFLFLLSENTLVGVPSSILFVFGLLFLVLFSTQILSFFETLWINFAEEVYDPVEDGA